MSGTDRRRLRRRRMRLGGLTIVTVLLAVSGVIRIGAGASGAALAVGSLTQDGDEIAAVGPCEGTPASEELLAAFRARDARLTAREAQLADRMQAMHIAEAEIDEKLVALQEAQQTLSATLAEAATAANDDITRLTAVYENMKAPDAAALFEEMAPEFAAGFMARMNAPAAAGIMTNLSAERAYSISAIIAGRNANAPTE